MSMLNLKSRLKNYMWGTLGGNLLREVEELGMIKCTCVPSTWEAEAGGALEPRSLTSAWARQ
jgi:hypothetical protein